MSPADVLELRRTALEPIRGVDGPRDGGGNADSGDGNSGPRYPMFDFEHAMEMDKLRALKAWYGIDHRGNGAAKAAV
jgi:hypothetical protein